MEVKTHASVKDGKLKVFYRDKFLQGIASLGDTDGELIYRKRFKKRSTKSYHEDGTEGLGQNGYYWSVIVTEYQNGCLQEQGRYITLEQAHEELKSNCSYVEHVNEDTGSIMRQLRNTSGMTTVQFEEYLESCRQFIYEWFGVTIPLPNEQVEMNLNE